ncbi:MAG: putative flap endonuclease-1-like 5' DNA nuclease [Spirosomataceae bacterium]|jgi:predicted flap endonuclease-1-like 5' DNA nuclease
MKIIDIVTKLDKMVTEGKIMQAFEDYFHDDVVTYSSANDHSKGKAEKRDFLYGFFENMNSIDEVTLHDTVIDDNKTFSDFTFKFTNKQNEELIWKEIIQRTWEGGLVTDEYYFEGNISEIKKEIKKKAQAAKKHAKEIAKKETAKISAPIATKTPKVTPKKIATPIKEAVPAKVKPVAKATKQNLKLIEGIGPKIEQLLKADGINTFADLAKATQTKLQAILTAAGPRFSMHSPDTWPQQAKLLADGKRDELKKLQAELKDGRKV